jgi:type IV fimbrial biogenesis protein FimT
MMNKINNSCHSGFTLIEMMITIAVMGIAAMMAMSAWSNQMARYEARSTMIEIAAVLKESATDAMVMHRRQVVCFTANQLDCIGTGFTQIMSFTDTNKNALRDPDESIALIVPVDLSYGQLKLSAGLGSRGFVFMEDTGRPRGTQGNVTYCADNGDMTIARSLIMSRQGRIRHSYDYNGDGVHDRSSRNDPVGC